MEERGEDGCVLGGALCGSRSVQTVAPMAKAHDPSFRFDLPRESSGGAGGLGRERSASPRGTPGLRTAVDEGFHPSVRMRENADRLRGFRTGFAHLFFSVARTRSRARKSRWVPRTFRSRPREARSHARECRWVLRFPVRVRENGFLMRESVDGFPKSVATSHCPRISKARERMRCRQQ
jgi:hypothetical protein